LGSGKKEMQNEFCLHKNNSPRNAMSGLMPPTVSTHKASGTIMSAIRPQHPLRIRCEKMLPVRKPESAAEIKTI
jgi:hypothetical protein